MDYSKLSATVTPKVKKAIALINNPEVAPEIRQRNQEILLKEVGQTVYNKVYQMNAYDFDMPNTQGPGIDDRHYGMAKIASDSVSAGTKGLDDYISNYVDQSIATAQRDAFNNAEQTGKRPTVVRRTTGKENCPWCDGLAGTYTDPGPEVFQRHRGCDCIINTSGYRSRNGLLRNYTKSDQNKSVIEQGGLRTENAAQKAMENALNSGNVAKAQQIVDGIQDQDLKTGLQGTLDALSGKQRKLRVDPVTKKIIAG